MAGDRLINQIFYGFILAYASIWCGEYYNLNSKHKLRRWKQLLFFNLRKRGYSLLNIVFQTFNIVFTIAALIVCVSTKERDLTVILARIIYLSEVYISVVLNLVIASFQEYKKYKARKKWGR